MDGSIYNQLGVDTYDKQRDAYNFTGNNTIIAHPPCAQWSRLYKFANNDPYAKGLAPHCYKVIQRNNGVLEHPAGSRFIKWIQVQNHGGFIYHLNQYDFGHRCKKSTALFIKGLTPKELPSLPLNFKEPERKVENISKRERDSTPIQFAMWLLEIAKRIKDKNG
jgi:hypothetical protein